MSRSRRKAIWRQSELASIESNFGILASKFSMKILSRGREIPRLPAISDAMLGPN